MWSYHRGQLYNRLGGRLALLNRTEARLVHWPEDGERSHRCLETSHTVIKMKTCSAQSEYEIMFTDAIKARTLPKGYMHQVYGEYIIDTKSGMVLTTEGKVYGDVFFSIPYTRDSREALRQMFIVQPVACMQISRKDNENNSETFLDCNLIESLVHLHTTHRKCKKWVLDTYDTGVKTNERTKKGNSRM